MRKKKEKECITILGGTNNPNSMGKACTLADIQTRNREHFYRLIIDDGMEFSQEPIDGEKASHFGNSSISPDISEIGDRKVDAVLATHLHADHVGALGKLIDVTYDKTGKLEISSVLKSDAKIFSTPQTAYGLEYTLRDGEMSNSEHTIIHSYEILRRRMMIPHPGVCEILPGLPVFWKQNGHLSGSSAIAIPTGSGGIGLITGDMCREDMPITKGWELPSESWPTEWIPDQIWGTDLTYGAGTKPLLSAEVTKLQEQARADLLKGKKVVIASFRTGRGQNLPMWLSELAREFKIPVWIDGSISNIYNIFQKHRWSDRDGELPELGEASGIMKVRDSKHRQALLEKEGPAIFITTSGMGNFGPIVNYLKYGLPREDFSFYFTSWLAEDSNGFRLLKQYRKALELRKENPSEVYEAKIFDAREAGRYIKLPLRADVYHFKLGAHGDLNDFVAFVEDIVVKCRKGRPLKRIILTHGNFRSLTEGADALGRFTEELHYGNKRSVIYI